MVKKVNVALDIDFSICYYGRCTIVWDCAYIGLVCPKVPRRIVAVPKVGCNGETYHIEIERTGVKCQWRKTESVQSKAAKASV